MLYMTQGDIASEGMLVNLIARHIKKYAGYMNGSEGKTQAIMVATIEAKVLSVLDRDFDQDFIKTRISLLERKLDTWKRRLFIQGD